MNLVIVVVVYEKLIEDLPVYSILESIFKLGISVVIYDNSNLEQKLNITNRQLIYIHDARNIGIGSGYNYTFHWARQNGCKGILLLDHDSKVSLDYVVALKEMVFDNNIGAIVPMAFNDNRQISPVRTNSYVKGNFISLSPGIYDNDYMAINSGTLISVNALEAIGGFDLDFPLDFLDHWLFWRLAEENYRLQVLDFKMEHDLSILDYSKVSHERYNSILVGERKFYTKYKKKMGKDHRNHLILRTLKLFMKQSDRFFWRRTFKEFLIVRKLIK